MNLISVIVPVYKVELYLERCIESILSQSYRDFELILVDDGSPDRCGQICDDYSKKDERIRVIHKENGGLSDARNAGLNVAGGEYITFIDSDDWVSSQYLQILLNSLLKNHADICECEIQRVNTFQGVEKDIEIEENPKVYSSEEAELLLIKDQDLHQYVWNKIYRKSCIDGIMFEIVKTNEDEFWTYQVFGRANSVCKISSVLYFYFQREDSIIGQTYSLKRLDALEAKEKRLAYMYENFQQLVPLAQNNLYTSCIYAGQMTLKYMAKDEQDIARKRIDNIRKKINPMQGLNNLSALEKMWVILSKINFWGLCRLKNRVGKGF